MDKITNGKEVESLRSQAKALLCGLPLEHRHELLFSVINKKIDWAGKDGKAASPG